MLRSILTSTLVLLAVGAASASAQEGTNAPPGLSAADQYLETIPSATGGRTVGNGQRPDLATPEVEAAVGGVLAAETATALRRAGPDGRDAAALAASGAPPVVASPPEEKESASGGGGGTPESKGPFAVATRIATGSDDGMGLLFPLLIVLGAAVVVGPVLWRRWSTGS